MKTHTLKTPAFLIPITLYLLIWILGWSFPTTIITFTLFCLIFKKRSKYIEQLKMQDVKIIIVGASYLVLSSWLITINNQGLDFASFLVFCYLSLIFKK